MPTMSGVTRGVTGAPEGNVQLFVFRTSDDSYIGTITSNPDGSWSGNLPDDGPFYLVGRKGSLTGASSGKRKPGPAPTPPPPGGTWTDSEAWNDAEAWSD